MNKFLELLASQTILADGAMGACCMRAAWASINASMNST